MSPKDRRCTARGCNYVSKHKQGNPMFTFPKHRGKWNRLPAWLQNSGNTDLLRIAPDKLHNYFLCQDHFQPEAFTNKCKVLLHRTAIPTIFNHEPLSHDIMQQYWVQFDTPITVEKQVALSVADTPTIEEQVVLSVADTTVEEQVVLLVDTPTVEEQGQVEQVLQLPTTPIQNNLKRPLPFFSDLDRTLDPPDNKIQRECSPDPRDIPFTLPRRSLGRNGARVRTLPPTRVSLQSLVPGVNIKDEPPHVIQPAKTAQEYQQMVLTVKRQLEKAQRKNASLKKISKKSFIDKVDELLISAGGKRLLKGEFKNFKKKPQGRFWDLEYKLFALATYKRSPRAYRFMRDHLTLPCETTLKKILQCIPLEPGINSPMLQLLTSSVQKMKKMDRNCVLLFDEVYLVPHIWFDDRKGHVEGLETFGSRGGSNLVSDHALVFMAQGIARKWTQPIAFYYVHKTCPSDMLKILIEDVVRALRGIGLNVLATVSDQGPTNRGAVAELKKSLNDDILYEIDGQKMVHLYDVPHIFKNVRNNLLASDLEYEAGRKAEWRHIIELFKLDEALSKLTKLTYKHVNPKGKHKMRVKYAVQALSASVAGAIKEKYAVSDGKYLSSCLPTAEFCEQVDKFFNLSNGQYASGKEKPNEFRKVVTPNSCHHTEWPQMLQKLKQWTYIRKSTGVRHVPPCVKGWMQTIQGFHWLWVQVQKLGFRRLNLRNLNQDAIENLFCAIRQCCGSSTDLTTVSFLSSLKTCLLTNYSGAARDKNCMDDGSHLLDDMRSLIVNAQEKIIEPATEAAAPTLQRGAQPISEELEKKLNQISKEAPVFICASLLNDVLKGSDCSHCLNFLTTSDKDPSMQFTKSASHMALRSHIQHYPSTRLISSFKQGLENFHSSFQKILHKKTLVSELSQTVKANFEFSSLPCSHSLEIQDTFSTKMVNCLLKRQCKVLSEHKKKGVFKRTSQTLHTAPKTAEGLRVEDDELEISAHDEALLTGSEVFLIPKPVSGPAKAARPEAPSKLTNRPCQNKTQNSSIHLTPGTFRMCPGTPRTPHIPPNQLLKTSAATPLLTTPFVGILQTPLSAHSKVLASWSGTSTTGLNIAPLTPQAQIRTYPERKDMLYFSLFEENKIDKLTVPQLGTFLKGKVINGKVVRISGLRKPQLVKAVNTYYST